MQNNTRKTVMCKSCANKSKCPYGTKCNFAHSLDDQQYINQFIAKLDNKITTINYKELYEGLKKLYLSEIINKKCIQEIYESLKKYSPQIPKIIPENFIELYKIWHTLATFDSTTFKISENDKEYLLAIRYLIPCKIEESGKFCIYGKNCNSGHRSNGKQICIKDLTCGSCDCSEQMPLGQHPYLHLVSNFSHEPLQPPVKNITIITTYETEYPLLSTEKSSKTTIVEPIKISYTDICNRNIKIQKDTSLIPVFINYIKPTIKNNINPDIVGNDCQIALNNPELFKQYEQIHPTYNITFTSWLNKDPLKSQAYNIVLFHNISFNNALYYVKNKLKKINISINEFITYINKYQIKSVYKWIEVNKKLNNLDMLLISFETFKLNENNYYDYYITTEYYKHNTFDAYCQEKDNNWTFATKQGHKIKTKVLNHKKDKLLTKITSDVITNCFIHP
jgi:hypothetical protein